jgi:magnesium transporter
MEPGSILAVERSSDGSLNAIEPHADSLREGLARGDSLLWVDIRVEGEASAWPLGEVFGFHALTIEDVVSPRVDPAKVDDYGDYLFIISQSLTHPSAREEMQATEVSFYVGPNYIVSCHQAEAPAIQAFRARFERAASSPAWTPTRLLHGLLDSLVDEYTPIVDDLNDEVDRIEADVLTDARTEALQQILLVRRNSLRVRRATAPQRDIMLRLARGEFPRLIQQDYAVYFRDIYDHLVRTEYHIESLRDLADGALQTYLSVGSNRLNQVMKVLTAAATVFLPLTVITGVYGMNFEDNQFPGFDDDWGFAAVVGLMFLNSLVMLAYFRYRRWV